MSRYRPGDFMALLDRHGIAWHEKTLGQLFCDDSARQVVAMLVAECAAASVETRLAHRVTELRHDGRFRVETDKGEFSARALVLATGALSIRSWAPPALPMTSPRQFGVPVVPPAPAARSADLPGARPRDDARALRHRLRGNRSHRADCLQGSDAVHPSRPVGPAILQASSYLAAGDELTIDLLPERDALAWLLTRKRERSRIALRTALAEVLPQRLAQALAPDEDAPPIGGMTDRALAAMAERLKRWRLVPSGTEGYAKAEVTRGGVDTRGLSSQTMEARTVPGLHFVGEAVDVTGWLGGYNFQWAWASGWSAGRAV